MNQLQMLKPSEHREFCLPARAFQSSIFESRPLRWSYNEELGLTCTAGFQQSTLRQRAERDERGAMTRADGTVHVAIPDECRVGSGHDYAAKVLPQGRAISR